MFFPQSPEFVTLESLTMIDDMLSAFGFLTVLPLTNIAGGATPQPGKMYSYFPLVGLLIGVVVGIVAAIQFLPRGVVAFMALAVWVILSGGLHLDGWADSCDGLFSAALPERRREILKDPHLGTWAAVGVGLLLIGKWTAMSSISPLLLIVPPVMGRWAIVIAAAAIPRATTTGMASRFAVGFTTNEVVIASVIALVPIIGLTIALGWTVLAAAVISMAAAYGFGTWAAGRLGGGITGDVYGAVCELTELVCLVTLTLRI
jgi:adenosylcobinamide-GDP ribazoletransferase